VWLRGYEGGTREGGIVLCRLGLGFCGAFGGGEVSMVHLHELRLLLMICRCIVGMYI